MYVKASTDCFKVELLRRAVACLTPVAIPPRRRRATITRSSSHDANSIPWKKVAEYMAHDGGYEFGYTTCKRKWTELTRDGGVSLKR